jgi:hypothetical protein
MVHFQDKWIGSLSLIIKFSLAIGCLYLMIQRESYQVFDRSPISAVTIKVKQSTDCSSNSSIIYHYLKYNCNKSLYDVNDFILPATENSAVSITTRIVEIEHILKYCNNRKMKNISEYSSLYISSTSKCYHRSRCILPPFYRYDYDNEDKFKKYELCWFKLPSTHPKLNYEALDYIIFIKNFVEFPQLSLVRHNLLSNIITKNYLNTCEYDSHKHPLCPKFRIFKILEMLQIQPHEYELIFFYGSLIEIKISWKCNLDRNLKYCEPFYEFQRLDVQPYDENPFNPGSNFLTSRHFFRPNDRQLHRVHTHIYNLHIIVSVTGEAGKFDLFQTTTSIGSFLGIFGTGSIVCDLIATFTKNFKNVKYDN